MLAKYHPMATSGHKQSSVTLPPNSTNIAASHFVHEVKSRLDNKTCSPTHVGQPQLPSDSTPWSLINCWPNSDPLNSFNCTPPLLCSSSPGHLHTFCENNTRMYSCIKMWNFNSKICSSPAYSRNKRCEIFLFLNTRSFQDNQRHQQAQPRMKLGFCFGCHH